MRILLGGIIIMENFCVRCGKAVSGNSGVCCKNGNFNMVFAISNEYLEMDIFYRINNHNKKETKENIIDNILTEIENDDVINNAHKRISETLYYEYIVKFCAYIESTCGYMTDAEIEDILMAVNLMGSTQYGLDRVRRDVEAREKMSPYTKYIKLISRWKGKTDAEVEVLMQANRLTKLGMTLVQIKEDMKKAENEKIIKTRKLMEILKNDDIDALKWYIYWIEHKQD